jgi:hypothetical protein
MATFPQATGFYTSAMAFAYREQGVVTGISSPSAFAAALAQKGEYGVGNPQFAPKVTNVINNVAIRLNCK